MRYKRCEYKCCVTRHLKRFSAWWCKRRKRRNWLINNQHFIWRRCKNKFAHCFFDRTLSESRLWTNCTTSRHKRCVTIFVLSECHIFWFLNLLIMKSWCRLYCFEHCTAIWITWVVSSFILFLSALNVRIVLIWRLRWLFEETFQSRKWFEFVTQHCQKIDVVLKIVYLHYVDWASRDRRRDINWILKMIAIVDDDR